MSLWSRRASLVLPFSAGLVLWAACAPSRSAWHAQLAAAHVDRLAGDWQVELVADQPGAHRVVVNGSIAMTVNDAAVSASGLGTRPYLFGTYDIDFSPLRVQPGVVSGVPALVGVVRGDSLMLALAPSSDLPIEMRGAIAGDSVTGTWGMSARAEPAAMGHFTLRRR